MRKRPNSHAAPWGFSSSAWPHSQLEFLIPKFSHCMLLKDSLFKEIAWGFPVSWPAGQHKSLSRFQGVRCAFTEKIKTWAWGTDKPEFESWLDSYPHAWPRQHLHLSESQFMNKLNEETQPSQEWGVTIYMILPGRCLVRGTWAFGLLLCWVLFLKHKV